jgi:hypothetical protein
MGVSLSLCLKKLGDRNSWLWHKVELENAYIIDFLKRYMIFITWMNKG